MSSSTPTRQMHQNYEDAQILMFINALKRQLFSYFLFMCVSLTNLKISWGAKPNQPRLVHISFAKLAKREVSDWCLHIALRIAMKQILYLVNDSTNKQEHNMYSSEQGNSIVYYTHKYWYIAIAWHLFYIAVDENQVECF